jgi:hypothetical protein
MFCVIQKKKKKERETTQLVPQLKISLVTELNFTDAELL